MIKVILSTIAIIIAIILGVAAFKSPDFRVVRSAKISASPEFVFNQVNDFHKWEAWSPWKKMDPSAKNSFDGSPSGVGAGFAWDGNKNVGVGRMTITESHPNDLIKIKLEFIKPLKGMNTTVFTFKPEGKETFVTWDMTGKSSFPARVFCLFMNMDKMVGGQFEQGLTNLNALALASSRK